jgi:galactokinase
MGGIADYSGSLVLQLPIIEATFAAVQLSSDRSVKLVTLNANVLKKSHYFEMPLDDFTVNNKVIDYDSAQKYFQNNPSTQWSAYVAGVFLVLMKEKGIHFKQGLNILIYSRVPEGKGVASSAALEVAAFNSIIKAYNISISDRKSALLCQKIENHIIGAPCGVMDQMTAVFGKKNHLLALLCQPAQMKPFIKIPEEISFWGIDSGIKHSVSGQEYTSVRAGTFMGKQIISHLIKQHKINHHVFRQNSYLADITPSLFEHYFANDLPEKMKGSEFIQKYQKTDDVVTELNPKFTYRISTPTAHPIYENFRVNNFAELLKKPMTDENLTRLGELMYQSHQSYSACGLGSTGTDRLVELSREFGPGTGVFGAKITGGGSGGTVVILSKTGTKISIQKIAEKYSRETGYHPTIFSGSSIGSREFGHLILKTVR